MGTIVGSRWLAMLSATALGLTIAAGTQVSAARKVKQDAAKQKLFNAALAEGRKLADHGKNPEAIAAFQRALAIDPSGVRALSELGLAHYRLKQYAEAEAAMRKALKGARDPGQRGRSYYNLGLILEGKGNTQGAIAAYSDSLKARYHQVVLERLRKLDAAAASALDPVAPRRMRGPFPTLEAMCAALNDCKKRMEDSLSAGPVYECKTATPLKALAKATAPFEAVQVFATTCKEEPSGEGDTAELDYESVARLGVRSASGWYVSDVGSMSADSRSSSDLKVLELRFAAGAGGAPRVWLRVQEEAGGDSGTGSTGAETESLVVAGIGASGVPSATPPLLLRNVQSEEPGAIEGGREIVQGAKSKLKPSLNGDELDLAPQGKPKALAETPLAPAGKHPLAFP